MPRPAPDAFPHRMVWRDAAGTVIHTFTENMTNGAGYLALAAVIFGGWNIGRTIAACLLVGAATALQFQLPAMGINVPTAFLLMLPYLLALLAVAGVVGLFLSRGSHPERPQASAQVKLEPVLGPGAIGVRGLF